MCYSKMKKAELVDIAINQENEIYELLSQIEWMGDVERKADERIQEVREEGINLLEDVLYKLRWIQSTEDDAEKALEDTIRTLSGYIARNYK